MCVYLYTYIHTYIRIYIHTYTNLSIYSTRVATTTKRYRAALLQHCCSTVAALLQHCCSYTRIGMQYQSCYYYDNASEAGVRGVPAYRAALLQLFCSSVAALLQLYADVRGLRAYRALLQLCCSYMLTYAASEHTSAYVIYIQHTSAYVIYI